MPNLWLHIPGLVGRYQGGDGREMESLTQPDPRRYGLSQTGAHGVQAVKERSVPKRRLAPSLDNG